MRGCFGSTGRVLGIGFVVVVAIIWAGCSSLRKKEEYGNFDRRSSGGGEAELSVRRTEGAERLRGRLPEVEISIDRTIGSPRLVTRGEGYLTETHEEEEGREIETFDTVGQLRWPRDPYGAVKRFLEENAGLYGHGAEVLESAEVIREHVTAHNGMRTVVWAQKIEGLPVFEGILVAHISKEGALISLSSHFLPIAAPESGLRAAASGEERAPVPGISAYEAVMAAARNIGEEVKEREATVARMAPEGEQTEQMVSADFVQGEAEAELVWLPMDRTTLRLCWQTTLTGKTTRERFRVVVDADDGEVLVRQRLTGHLSDATYRVFGKESPSPFSPGHADPSTNQPPTVDRVLRTLVAVSLKASPEGWIPEGETRTIGNNVDARTDLFNDNANLGYDALITPPNVRPESASRVFDFPLDLSKDPSTYRAASVVNAFYWANWIHDVLYDLGFDEAAGNFQQDNFQRGGRGGDAALIDVQNGAELGMGNGGSSHADPEDGGEFRIELFVWRAPEPDRDGALDVEVLIHEYLHGVCERRVGKGAAISGHQSLGLVEGWADFFAMATLSEPSDDLDGNYPYAAYSSHEWVRSPATNKENYYFGMRRYPYSTEMSKNPLTFKDIDERRAIGHPEAPRNPILPFRSYFGGYVPDADEWHAQGEVWCVTLWEARSRLIQKYGPIVGHRMSLRLVMDGMNLAPRNPTFLEARDAILKADEVSYGKANERELWEAFAKRGMGYGAEGPPSSKTPISKDIVESYKLPPSGDQQWSYSTMGAMFSSPAVGEDGTIYIGSKDKRLHAVNPDGSGKWVYPSTGTHSFDSSPAIGLDGTIYIGSKDAKLHAVNPNGTVKWTYQAYGEIFSSPAVAPEDDGSGTFDGSIYFGAVSGGRVYAVNKSGSEKWVFQTGNTVYSSPALSADGWVYIGSMDGKVYALNAMTGAQKNGWPFTTSGHVYSSPAIDASGTVVAGSYDGNVYAIRPDGTLKWSFASGEAVRCSPVIGPDGTVYVANAESLYALEGTTGAKKWDLETPQALVAVGAPAVAADGRIIYAAGNGFLYSLDSAGEVEWRFYKASVWQYSSPAVAPDGTVYFGTGGGKLYALKHLAGLAAGEWPMFRKNLRHTGY